MTDEIQIRPVQQNDFQQWKPLWDGYNASQDAALCNEMPPPDSTLRRQAIA